jgi:hypothetical protein
VVVKLVQLMRQGDGGDSTVVAAVGPMADAAADAYAAELLQQTEGHSGLGLSVGTTPVESSSGDSAEPPAAPAELLEAVLSKHDGIAGRNHELHPPDAST